MKTKKITSVLSFVLLILTISLLTTGGCDIEFSSDNDNGNGGGGNNQSILQGTIIDIVPDRSVEGITVEVEDEDSGNPFSDMTDSNGFFRIEGNFSGSPSRLQFLDETSTPIATIATTNITVFPGAEVDMGDITITNGIVGTDVINVIFEADIVQNNCSGDSGTLEVEVDNTDIIVQVSTSTNINQGNDDTLICEDLLVGDNIEIDGELSNGDIVDANTIEVL